eukprot:m.874229 g.874229  ORF g.874229 m.874229 type:complete len:341 (+) comp59796_c0_seq19:555-1577(+)
MSILLMLTSAAVRRSLLSCALWHWVWDSRLSISNGFRGIFRRCACCPPPDRPGTAPENPLRQTGLRMSSQLTQEELDTESMAADLAGTTLQDTDATRILEDFAHLRWFHGSLSRHHASATLLQNGRDGCFLLRASEQNRAALTLSVRALDSVKHFSITCNGGVYSMSRTITFGSATEFIRYFEAQPVISGESGVLTQLTVPYPRKVDEFIDYDQVRILTPFKAVASAAKPTEIDLSIVSKEGYLTKLGRIHKSWKTRWFVLWKDQLKYFKDRGASESVGSVDLRACTAVEPDTSMQKLYCFKLVSADRTLVMFASTQSEMDGWVKCLQWKIDSYRKAERA